MWFFYSTVIFCVMALSLAAASLSSSAPGVDRIQQQAALIVRGFVTLDRGLFAARALGLDMQDSVDISSQIFDELVAMPGAVGTDSWQVSFVESAETGYVCYVGVLPPRLSRAVASRLSHHFPEDRVQRELAHCPGLPANSGAVAFAVSRSEIDLGVNLPPTPTPERYPTFDRSANLRSVLPQLPAFDSTHDNECYKIEMGDTCTVPGKDGLPYEIQFVGYVGLKVNPAYDFTTGETYAYSGGFRQGYRLFAAMSDEVAGGEWMELRPYDAQAAAFSPDWELVAGFWRPFTSPVIAADPRYDTEFKALFTAAFPAMSERVMNSLSSPWSSFATSPYDGWHNTQLIMHLFSPEQAPAAHACGNKLGGIWYLPSERELYGPFHGSDVHVRFNASARATVGHFSTVRKNIPHLDPGILDSRYSHPNPTGYQNIRYLRVPGGSVHEGTNLYAGTYADSNLTYTDTTPRRVRCFAWVSPPWPLPQLHPFAADRP
jgi:hypothetical protein